MTIRLASTPPRTHHISLAEAPDAYATFQKKADGMVKAVITP